MLAITVASTRPGSERRTSPRKTLTRAGAIRPSTSQSASNCVVCDVSNGGARLFTFRNYNKGEKIEVLIHNDDAPRHCEVMWSRDEFIGVRFADPSEMPPQDLDALRPAPPLRYVLDPLSKKSDPVPGQ